MKSRDIIPVDDAIREFQCHLISHPRTILSARFGDGKSFFLDHFIRDRGKKFLCIRVYPVNYQVLDNKDIFEFVKRDILLQLIYNDLIPEDYEIAEDIAFAFYVRNNRVGLFEDLLKFASVMPGAITKLATAGAATWRKINKDFKSFKDENTYNGNLEKYIDGTNNHFLIEEDAITHIISDCFERYHKDHNGRRIALFFEDMDRIDPAHLFRIMNVLSAQMDSLYQKGIRPNANAIGINKFGVDNIVLVMDYDNLKALFAHFYGNDVNFKGYVHKFTSGEIFKFSIKEQQYGYIIKQLAEDTSFKEAFLKAILPNDVFNNYSIRDLTQALYNTESQIKEKIVYSSPSKSVSINSGVLKLFIFLRRLNKSDEDIKRLYLTALHQQPMDFLPLLGGYYLKFRNIIGFETIEIIDEDDNTFCHYKIESVDDSGIAYIQKGNRFSNSRMPNFEDEFLQYLLGLIA